MKKLLFSIALSFTLLFVYQNCSSPEVAFTTLSSTDPNTTQEIPTEEGKLLITENLGINTTSRNIDFVWVIDNSGSMNNEAAYVRDNYLAFMNSISQQAHIKSALISLPGNTGTAVSIPQELQGPMHKQISSRVSSVDAMSHLTGSLIDESDCSDYTKYYTTTSQYKCQNYAHKGDLRNFLRVNSKKIFVFVTDDNETLTTYDGLLAAFQNLFPNQTPITYGFLGLANSIERCYSRVGQRYIDLKNKTEGAYFDICKEDWTTHFQDMIDHVFISTENIFNLKYQNIDQVMDVQLDDKVLSKNQYTVENNTVTINPTLLSEKSKRVTVKYLINK